MIYDAALREAIAHARRDYPAESCGIVVDDVYIPCENKADPAETHDPENKQCGCVLCSFKIDPEISRQYDGKIQLVVHSHPDGKRYPSSADMQSQMASGLSWAIIPIMGDRVDEPLVWGGDMPTTPIIGRSFVHGVTDCYSLIRDTFFFGRDELAKQGISWPYDPIYMSDYPRDDAWWTHGKDMYVDNFAKEGFEPVPATEAAPGDIFLIKLRSDKFNHGGVLIGGGMILHHLPDRLSRREPSGIWARQAGLWIRYTGEMA